MFWRVEVMNKPDVRDPVGEGIRRDILDLGIAGVSAVRMAQVFIIEAEIPAAQIKRVCEELLCDPVIQEYRFGALDEPVWRDDPPADFPRVVEIAYNPGVMDPWEESTIKAIRDLGVGPVSGVKTGRRYLFSGKLTREQLAFIAEKLLYNKVIQHIVRVCDLKKILQAHKEVTYRFKKNTVGMISRGDRGLLALSRQGQLFLNLGEMRAIRDYFARLGRNPTDCELETLAQTWSEHCGHKTMRGDIAYRDYAAGKKSKKPRLIRNLLKTTIMDATKKLNKPWCVSVFRDNAGIIEFDKKNNVCFKVETHNHPSALEPCGGAGTGIGGVIRDILGAGLGARPVMNTDVFCFGPPDLPCEKLPAGVLHPKRVMKGVAAGVRDYGNRMGIPTANGAVLFDERYTGNPLVYCGTAGIMPKEHSFKKVSSGEYAVLVGGRTGRDGIHGATFSSGELTAESEAVSGGAVQIGNAITEKKVLDTLLRARDLGLYTAVTDCGGGGLSSAAGEMGQETGVRVDLDKVPLKYQGLSYAEIWISEAQERMLLSVPKHNLEKLLEVFRAENAEATVIGEFTGTRRLELFYHKERVCDLDMDFLHGGCPKILRRAEWKPPRIKEKKGAQPRDLTQSLLAVLSDLNVCSKEWIIRQYDHEVQAMSVLKPLAGAMNDGPQDAAVLRPFPGQKKGIIIACGISSRFGDIDPYWMAASCVDEALRQVVAVGGDLERTALLDNFSWANTSRPKVLGQLVRACLGCRDASLGCKTPFISGKDSLNNEFSAGGKNIAIPPTLLISAISVFDDVERTVSADAKAAGNLIYIVGRTAAEMGGSCYYAQKGWKSAAVPKVDFPKSRLILERLSACTAKKLVRSCHDCSDGGMAAALAETAFSGELGMEIDLAKVKHGIARRYLRDDTLLFSESNTRFIVEIEPRQKKAFETTLGRVPFSRLGELTEKKKFRVRGLEGRIVIDCSVDALKEAWQKPLNR